MTRPVRAGERRGTMLIQLLKQFDADRNDVEDLVSLSAVARLVQNEYSVIGVEEPDWLTVRVKEIRREIKARTQDSVEKELREAQARLESLKTPEEKRAAIREKIALLTEKLAKA